MLNIDVFLSKKDCIMTNEEYKKLEREAVDRDMAGHIFDVWERGLSCPRKNLSVLFESTSHVVLKHGSHAVQTKEFGNYRSRTCPVYAVLYAKDTHTSKHGLQDVRYGKGFLKM